MATTNTLMSEYFNACDYGDLEKVKKCVERGVDINGLDDGLSPFGCACENNHQQIVEYLIEKNRDVALPNEHNFTALMGASLYGHTKIAKLLLIQNSSLNFIRCQNVWGRTALMFAAQNGHEDVVKLLLFYDPSEEHILIKDKYGKTAIDLAKTEVTEKIRKLLSGPPEVQTKRAKSST